MKSILLFVYLYIQHACAHDTSDCVLASLHCDESIEFCSQYRILAGGWCSGFGMQEIYEKQECASAIQMLGYDVDSHVYQPEKSSWPGCQYQRHTRKIWQQGPNNPRTPGGMHDPDDGFVVVCKFSGLTKYTSVSSGLCRNYGYREILTQQECTQAARSLNIAHNIRSDDTSNYPGCSYTKNGLFINVHPSSSTARTAAYDDLYICARTVHNTCDTNAFCKRVSTGGSCDICVAPHFECECKEGYLGDGKTCTKNTASDSYTLIVVMIPVAVVAMAIAVRLFRVEDPTESLTFEADSSYMPVGTASTATGPVSTTQNKIYRTIHF